MHGRNQWKPRNVVPDRRKHRWPAVSANGIITGSVELQGNAYVAFGMRNEIVGKYDSLGKARAALLTRRD